ncbi:hypothetical protein L210DRAFT_3650790 [Boletus edulis BED1]|uniref:Haloacid dehalogenase n=1 Tax=Boletus edulis BED1 TaxID=1328754 RepID=A0AAD4BIL2_BOLED|nr:hypothetical protein L210DRAFT_3650790 [Boletus edulis BED1]
MVSNSHRRIPSNAASVLRDVDAYVFDVFGTTVDWFTMKREVARRADGAFHDNYQMPHPLRNTTYQDAAEFARELMAEGILRNLLPTSDRIWELVMWNEGADHICKESPLQAPPPQSRRPELPRASCVPGRKSSGAGHARFPSSRTVTANAGGEGTLNFDIAHRQILDRMLASPRWSHLGSLWDDPARSALVQLWHELDGMYIYMYDVSSLSLSLTVNE